MEILYYVLAGLATGAISGALGIGGGVLLVPILVWGFKLQQTQAQGITLVVLVVPVVLPAVLQYYAHGLIKTADLAVAGWIALGFVVGGLVGAYFVPHLPVETLRMLFGLMLIYVAVRFLRRSDSGVASAVVGLIAVSFAWICYIGLRMLGRKHLPRPDLGQKIRELGPQSPPGPDYYI